ncbi:MAG: glycosyltransferase [Endomicrobia bacterium]|nr:glycosyltransferase [Endomicrobiia bacterium]
MFDFLIIVSKHKRPLSDGSLSRFINCKIEGVTFEYKTAQWTLSERRDRFALFCTDNDLQKHIAAGEAIRFFDGMIFQDECINDIRKLSPILGNNADHSDVFGRYVYGELQETDLSHVHRDVLGCEPLFIGFGADLTAIGNNPALCAQAVYGENYKSHKNAAALAQIVLIGATQDLSTSFHNIFLVPQNAGILIDKENAVSFYSLIDKMYYPMPQEEWDLQFEKTRQTCVNLLSKGNIQRGTVTGGYDSRVTLALAIEAGIHKNIQFSVRGYGDHPDVVIAKQIADYYGLKLEHNEVVVADNENQDAVIEQSFDNALRAAYRQSGMREFRENWAATQILLSPAQSKPKSDAYQMTAGGAANEVFRGYLSLHKLLEKNKPNKIMDSGDREFLISDKIKKGVLSENIYSALYYKLKRNFETYEDFYSYDLDFARTRMPQFHAGLNNRSGFSIGFNPWLHRLSMIQAPELRVGGQTAFKLIEKSEPELLYFPFAEKTWHPYAYAGNQNEARLRQIKPCANLNKRPLPSMTNVIKQMKFLFDRGFQLHDEIWKAYDEKYLSGLINDTKKIISENIKTNLGAPARLISIYGASLFLDNAELPIAQNEKSCKIELKNSASAKPNIYAPQASKHITDSETVCRREDLLFSREPVFRASDHNHLTDFQKKMLEMIKISVIIPVYNAEKHLKQCLDSVINQTLKDIEIICVNDGSTDNSLKILKEYAERDSRILIVEQENQGAGAARNNGLAHAKGEYLSFLDSDDHFEPLMLEEMFARCDKFGADICLCDAYVYEKGQLQNTRYLYITTIKAGIGGSDVFSYKHIPDRILNISSPVVWNKLFRKDFVIDSGIKFQTVKFSNDIYFAVVLTALAQKITFIDKKFVHYIYNHSDSTTALRKENKNMKFILEIYKDVKSVLRQKGIFELIKASYDKKVLESVLYAYNTMRLEARKDFVHMLKKELSGKQFKQLKRRIDMSLPWYQHIFSVRKENSCKVVRIFGLKIKIRNDKRDKMKKFFKNLINVYNDGDYKVFKFLFIRAKIKNKHKILITQLEQQQTQIAALNDKLSLLDKKYNDNTLKNIEMLEQQQTQIAALNDRLSLLDKNTTDFFKDINKHVYGSANAQKFQSTISGSKWLKKQNFTAGGWAMDNLGLYTVFRILNDMKPQNILEFGLGQSSKLVHQYVVFGDNNAKAVTVEHDRQWIEFFENEVFGYKINIEAHDSAKAEINGAETLTYAGLKDLCKQKFDFILVDGPFGQKRYSRPQILDFVKAGLPERFCILIDDTEREGEKETLYMLLEILKEQKRECLTKSYTGEKNSHSVICSPDLKFLTSL